MEKNVGTNFKAKGYFDRNKVGKNRYFRIDILYETIKAI